MHCYYQMYTKLQRKLLDDDKEKIQSNIKRDTPEEKVKDLLNWMKSVQKNDTHKVSIIYVYCLTLFFMKSVRLVMHTYLQVFPRYI